MTTEQARCKSCGASIVWITSAKRGKAVPCDPRRVTIIDEDGLFHIGYQSHFGSCPQAWYQNWRLQD